MRKTINLFHCFFLISLALLLNNCAGAKMTKQLSTHQLALERAVSGNMSSEEKFDVLGETLVTALDEAMSFTNPRRTVQYFDKFSKQNEKSIDKILSGLGGWKEDMSPADQLMFFGRVAGKPYTKRLITLIPKFERKVNRKIKTFTFAAKVLKFLLPKRLLGGIDL